MKNRALLQGRIGGLLVRRIEHRIGHNRHSCLGSLVLLVLGDALNGSAARGKPPGSRELQGYALTQGKQSLHQTLSEGRSAYDYSAIVILERSGDNLGGTRCSIVHQDYDREVGPGLP